MKKILFSMGVMLAATFTLTNCTEELQNPQDFPSSENEFELIAQTVDTKTVNDGMSTKWEAKDSINVFHAEAGSETYVNDGKFIIAEADLAEGRFTGNLSADLKADGTYDWYAFYPYISKMETPANTEAYAYIGHSKGLRQNGYDNMDALKRTVCPLYGVAKAVAGDEMPGITMQHLSSVLAIEVANTVDTPLIISTSSFTAPEDVVGSYYIDFSGEPVYVPSDGYTYSTATVNVSGGTELAKGETATLYLAIKPFTAKSGSKLVLSVNGYEKELTLEKDVTFHAGKIKTLKFDYDYVTTAKTATFDFNANEWGLPVSAQGTENDGNITSPVKSGDVTMTAYNGTASTATRLWKGSSKVDLRAYKGSSLAFSVPEGYVITKMTFSGSKVSDELFTPANGTYSSKIWEGKSNPAIFTFTGTINVDTVVVEYEEGTGDSPELPEEPGPETPPTSSGTKTVAEFISAADTQNYYELTGTVSNFNSNYCSFDLTDASGTIYVYSVLSASKSEWASKISDGGTVTLLGKYLYYEKSSKHEVVDAHIVSFTAGTTEPDEPEVGGDEDGTTVTFDWATLATTTNQEYTGQTVDGVKLEGYRVATNKAGQLRVYKPDNGDNAYFTLSAEKLITRVEITFTGEDNDGPLTAEGYADGVWEGSANAVTFTNASAEQARIKKIVVTLGN